MAAAAAWWPARTMARLPVMAALSGRPSRPAAVHRSLAVAAGLLALGVAGIAARPPDQRPRAAAAADRRRGRRRARHRRRRPAAIRALARPAAPPAVRPRLALRDLARYQARAAAALAAITLGLGIAVTVVVLAQANVARSDQGNLSDRQLVIAVGDPRTAPVAELSADRRGAARRRGRGSPPTLGDAAAFPSTSP